MECGLDAAALHGLSYRELQLLAKKHGVKANQKKHVLQAALLPFATGGVATGAKVAEVAMAGDVASAVGSPSKRARKTLIDEVLAEGDDGAVAASSGAWGETTPVRMKPVDESAFENADPSIGRSPRGIPLKPSGNIDFDAFHESVRKKAKLRAGK